MEKAIKRGEKNQVGKQRKTNEKQHNRAYTIIDYLIIIKIWKKVKLKIFKRDSSKDTCKKTVSYGFRNDPLPWQALNKMR